MMNHSIFLVGLVLLSFFSTIVLAAGTANFFSSATFLVLLLCLSTTAYVIWRYSSSDARLHRMRRIVHRELALKLHMSRVKPQEINRMTHDERLAEIVKRKNLCVSMLKSVEQALQKIGGVGGNYEVRLMRYDKDSVCTSIVDSKGVHNSSSSVIPFPTANNSNKSFSARLCDQVLQFGGVHYFESNSVWAKIRRFFNPQKNYVSSSDTVYVVAIPSLSSCSDKYLVARSDLRGYFVITTGRGVIRSSDRKHFLDLWLVDLGHRMLNRIEYLDYLETIASSKRASSFHYNS